MTSAYPKTVDALVPQARQLAVELGRTPSRNKLMSTLRIGRDKANEVLARLADGPTPTTTPTAIPTTPDPLSHTSPTEAEPGPARRLHVVTDTDRDQQPAPDPLGTRPGAAAETATVPDTAADHAPVQVSPVSAPGADIATPAASGGWWTRVRATLPAPVSTPVAVIGSARRGPARSWPLVLLALPAFVAIWSGWVGLGALTGFGPVHPLPGIAPGFALNTAITLPIGVETYAAYALRVWLTGTGSATARRFAKWSAIGSLVLGAAGQVAYHLMTAAHVTAAPWEITTVVACLPVVVLGCGAGLLHLTSHQQQHTSE